MAHFAKINKNTNQVLQVIGIHNNELLDENGIESEQKGLQFIESLYGIDPNIIWKKTSYNTWANTHKLGGAPFRKNYAAVEGYYDPIADAFYKQQPYPSWTLNQETFLWEAPIPRPSGPVEDLNVYTWNEENQTWDLNNPPE